MERDRRQQSRDKPRIRLISPITRRILAVNVLALGILVAGILYLDEYKANLINAELTALATQAELFAVALSEGAVAETASGHYRVSKISKQMVRRMVKTTGTRARLFRRNGKLAADSRRLAGAGRTIQIEELPPPVETEPLLSRAFDVFDRLIKRFRPSRRLPPYQEKSRQHISDYPEAVAALGGDYVKTVRAGKGDAMVLGVAVPVQRYKEVLGALLLTKGSHNIDDAIFEVRRDILKVFGVVLVVTVLLSIYLARTIARPLRHLALAAEQVRHDRGRSASIPDMSSRRDEIGELAVTLREMTEALWSRMDAIESFAADVAHEIKNPLTSLRSAVETAARLKDPEQQKKLMEIIADDVGRLDRLITDISDASRLDAELSRGEATRVDISAMLAMLADVHNTTRRQGGVVKLERTDGDGGALMISGQEGRLAQVFRNLISNANSFSPEEGRITITVSREDGMVRIDVDDEGPGIPVGAEQRIFERFYSERPDKEKFGTHSGLGLNISAQIVDAHEGTLDATNRTDLSGNVIGARFTVRLPGN
jgi:two-component system, OmpR family, sensor histidine kinase ChvG